VSAVGGTLSTGNCGNPVIEPSVLIAGGGIGGLSVALTLEQIGVPCMVFESVRKLRPLGVGINLQPNAVRELYDLDIGPKQLDRKSETRRFGDGEPSKSASPGRTK
jgi:2-polyprenyl-6-methoxyphenol hydroxylase-like FAD-dependent oxidoreductase